jgi:hypothetical protein
MIEGGVPRTPPPPPHPLPVPVPPCAPQNFYPCPKCDKGLLKLRHHVCPCDQEKIGANGIVRVTYGTKKAAEAPAGGAPPKA